MKKFTYLAIMLLVMAGAVSCEKYETVKEEQSSVEKAEMVFTASSEDGLRTTMSSDGTTVVWSSNDKLKVFTAEDTQGSECNLTKGAGTATAEFAGQCAKKGPWTAICPSSASKAYNDGIITLSLPEAQTYVAGTFADGVMPCVAYSNKTVFSFSHVYGVIKFSFKGEGTVDNIKITDKNNKKLNGTFTVKPAESAIATYSTGGTTAVTLNCGTSGVALNTGTAKDFWIVVPAGAFDKGFEAIVVSKDGKLAKVGSKSGQTIVRGGILSMPELTIEFKESAQEWEFKNTQGWEMIQVL